MDSDRPATTAQPASRLQDIDVEPAAANLQRATPPPNPNPQQVRTQVVRDVPNAPPAGTISILSYSEQNLGDVFAAVSAAQGEFGEIERTLRANVESKRTGAKYSYDYAPLDEVLEAVRPATSKHGLSIMQFPAVGNGFVIVKTLLGHKSGGWISNDLKMPCDTNGPQECGSGITFARRYSIMPILGVAPAVDDDGGAAQPKGEMPRAGERRQPPQSASTAPAAQQQPAGRKEPKPAGRAARPAQAAPAAAQTPAPQDSPAQPAAPPAASQPVEPPAQDAADGEAQPVGRIVDLVEKPNGAIVVLEGGFRAASKDADTTKALKVHKSVNATLRLTTRPSSDPSRFAPVITKIEIVRREREPGEEG